MKFNQIISIFIFLSISLSITLQEVYDSALPGYGYDKYIVLEPDNIYTGNIGIFEGNVFIDCQGSILDLLNGSGIWVYADEDYQASLDIEYCTIYDSQWGGLNYYGISNGNITNCNFMEHDIGLMIFDQSNVIIKNSNFINNERYGLGIITELPHVEISYSNFWGNEEADCMENCPG